MYKSMELAMEQPELLAIIRSKHAESGLTYEEFAHSLGVTRSMLTKALSQERGLGRKFLSGLVNRYPELQPEVLRYLRSN
jgi:antitoxin component HigA of HigAB toxin-antitoxin module